MLRTGIAHANSTHNLCERDELYLDCLWQTECQ